MFLIRIIWEELPFNILNAYYLFEREREGEEEAEREGERIPSRLHTVSTEPDLGLDLGNCDIMT